MLRKRIQVIFSGRVQGVGFRMRTFHLAKQYNVVGFVRNEPDKTVLMVAEGEKAEIESLLSEILSEMDGFIRQHQSLWQKPTDEFIEFRIQH